MLRLRRPYPVNNLHHGMRDTDQQESDHLFSNLHPGIQPKERAGNDRNTQNGKCFMPFHYMHVPITLRLV